VRVCEARIELGQLIKARQTCENALFTFIASRFSDEVKETEALLARIDLARAILKRRSPLERGARHSGTTCCLSRSLRCINGARAPTPPCITYRDAYNDLAEYIAALRYDQRCR